MKPRVALPLLALLGAVAWLFRDVLFLGGVHFKRDIHLVWYPQVEGFVRSVAAGAWPVWDAGAARLNLRIVDLAVRYHERQYGETNISRFSHGWLLLQMSVFAARKLKLL